MKPISKFLYLGPILIGFSVLIFGIVWALIHKQNNENVADANVGFLCCGQITTLFGITMIFVLVHKLWTAVQYYGPARTTPGKAVGLLFIPFFNLYWIFQVFYGWAVDYNKYIIEEKIDTSPVSEGLAKTFCILILLSLAIPYVCILIGLVNLVVMFVFLSKAIDGANAIIAHRGAATREI